MLVATRTSRPSIAGQTASSTVSSSTTTANSASDQRPRSFRGAASASRHGAHALAAIGAQGCHRPTAGAGGGAAAATPTTTNGSAAAATRSAAIDDEEEVRPPRGARALLTSLWLVVSVYHMTIGAC